MTEGELFNIVQSLVSKLSPGFDGVSTKNFKLIYPHIAPVLIKIINNLLKVVYFPTFQK